MEESEPDYNYIVNVGTVIAIVVQLPFVIVNVRLFYVVFKRRSIFGSAFYQVVFYNGIADLLCVFCTNYCIAFPNIVILDWYFEYFKGPSYNFNVVILFGRFYFKYLSQIGILLLAINRFSSIAFMFHYDKIWTKYWNVILFVYFMVPFIFTFSLLLNRNHLVKDNFTNYSLKALDYDHSVTFNISMSIRTLVYDGTVMTAAFLFNLYTIMLLFKKGRVRGELGNNFLGYALFVFALHLLSFGSLLVFQNFRIAASASQQAQIIRSYLESCGIPLTTTALSLAPGIMLIATSSDIRTAVFPTQWRRSRSLLFQAVRSNQTSVHAKLLAYFLEYCMITLTTAALSLAPGVLLIITSSDVQKAVFPSRWQRARSKSIVTAFSTK